MMNIAVFGDIHGHLLQMYRIVQRWQRENKKKIDLILSTGDIGTFGIASALDKATQRFAKKDPEELGFQMYFETKSPEADSVLEDKENPVTADFAYIKGNHEDFNLLENHPNDKGQVSYFPVDYYGKMFYLKNNGMYIFEKEGVTVSIGGLGGLDRDTSGRNPEKYQTGAFLTNKDFKDSYQMDNPNILLVHDTPHGTTSETEGSYRLLEIIKYLRPEYCFFGHCHKKVNYGKLDDTRTSIYGMNEVTYYRNEDDLGAMGIIEWKSEKENSFYYVEEGWVKEYTKHSFDWLIKKNPFV